MAIIHCRPIRELANAAALEFQHECIYTEDFLYAIVQNSPNIGVNMLQRLGLNPNEISLLVRERTKKGSGPVVWMNKLAMTPTAQQVIIYAEEEARRLSYRYATLEHLILGLLRQEKGSVVQGVFADLGATLDAARALLACDC